jgi:hypothetical protein
VTTPNFTWTCLHCGQQCGGRLETGYAAFPGEFTPDGAIHASCSPDDPTAHPDCHRRVTEFGEPVGALRDVRPLPVGVEDIRSAEARH